MRRLFPALLFLLLPCFLAAQEFRATISGHVYDASGAGVPNAKIEAINTANNEIASATSDPSGSYSVPFLRPGQYRITVSAPGFKQYNRENVTLEVGKTTGIDISLELGQITESVNVTADAAVL
ncbi:MAG: carboxypeptidase-like regulatory domain-containing protein, partial [Bryobacteraceae bacterium]